MIIWIIGLSGSGKTTLAKEVVRLARVRHSNVALVDGDLVREVWGDDLGHTLADRRINAQRLCQLCRYLESQSIHAVGAILSIFEQSREWNRANLGHYHEVYLKASLADLEARDAKGLYAKARRGQIELPGVNMDFPEPTRPDTVVENNGDRQKLLAYAKPLAALLD